MRDTKLVLTATPAPIGPDVRVMTSGRRDVRRLLLPASLAMVLAVGFATTAWSQQSGSTRSMRQEIIRECNAEATAKKLEGAALKQAVDECTKAKSEASPQQVLQQKTTLCNRRATQNKVMGHDRQHFVEDCVAASTELAEHHEKMFQCSRRATQERVFDLARKGYVDNCMKN
jgi:hypothetical protein